MRKKLTSFLLLLSLLILLLPAAYGQERLGSIIKRDKNGYKVGDTRISFFDGPGIVNYEYRHRWMPGPAGAALVAKGPVLGDAVPGVVREVVGECHLLRRVEDLTREVQGGDRHER